MQFHHQTTIPRNTNRGRTQEQQRNEVYPMSRLRHCDAINKATSSSEERTPSCELRPLPPLLLLLLLL